MEEILLDQLLASYATDDYDAHREGKLPMVSCSSSTSGVFLHPSTHQVAAPQSSHMPPAHLKRQFSDVTTDRAEISDVTTDRAEKKRMTDKAYRQRCKEFKETTAKKLDMLTAENNELKQENNFLRREEVQLKQSFESQKVEMNQLKKEFGQLKGELSRQNLVVEVLSNRLAGSNDINLLQLENEDLKRQIDLLKRKITDPKDLNIIQLQGKIAKLEHKNRAFDAIIDALCKKINSEDPQQEHSSQ